MADKKNLMTEIALLYYKKGLTQQEIAKTLQLTRQTVSKFLTIATEEKLVEIIIHNPDVERKELQLRLKELFGITAIVCGVSQKNDELRRLVSTETAVEYLSSVLQKKPLRIGLSWGRSVQSVVKNFPSAHLKEHTIFPLFGATEHEQTYFLPNELAREFASKLNAKVKYAWFPYKTENKQDYDLFRRTDYYKNMEKEWSNLDLAILGIGNNQGFRLLNSSLEENDSLKTVVGDVATHFFTIDGALIERNEYSLRIAAEQLRNIKEKIAVAYGDDKIEAIIGAIKAQFVNTLITDEYTAKKLVEFAER